MEQKTQIRERLNSELLAGGPVYKVEFSLYIYMLSRMSVFAKESTIWFAMYSAGSNLDLHFRMALDGNTTQCRSIQVNPHKKVEERISAQCA